MLNTFILTLAALVSNAVLPSVGRPRTERLSRGPAWTDFHSLAINDAQVEVARQSTQGITRVAVIAVPATESTSSEAAEVAAELIRSGLMYGETLTVLDADSTRSIFGQQRDPELILKKAGESGIDKVVLANANADSLLSVDIRSTKDASLTELVPYKPNEGTKAVVPQASSYPKLLLGQLDATHSARAESLGRVPQANFDALTHYVNAKKTLGSIMGMNNEKQRKQICEQVLAEVQLAIDASPNFLEAYIVKASCQDELDESTELKRTLTTAFQKIDPSKHDQLTILELQGDYARFVQTDPLTALEAYQELLELSPTNLNAMWAIIDILLSGDGVSPADKESIETAAQVAAALIATHPNSNLAQSIIDSK